MRWWNGYVVASSDGVNVALVHLGGQGPKLLLAHATGFCATVWRPVAAALAADFDCWALVDGACTQQIDQPRQPGPKRAALQPRAMRQPNDRGLRCVRCKRAERRGRGVVVGVHADVLGESGVCIAGFAVGIQRHRCFPGMNRPVRVIARRA